MDPAERAPSADAAATERPQPGRILIIRLSAIGDVVMASALIPVLRNRWPKAFIAWLTEDTNADLLRHNPRLDRLFLWPRRRWRRLLRERRYVQAWREGCALLNDLRGQRFDLVLDVQGLMKSGLWAWLSGATERIGLGSREGSQYLMSRVIGRDVGGFRIGKEYLALARELGHRSDDFAMDVAISDDDGASARSLLDCAGVTQEYAVLCPFTTRPQKHWFDERWADLAHGLLAECDLAAIMLGAPPDRERAERIARQTKTGLINLTGQTTLGQCAALIANARLLIGVDTGLTHLGIALQTPTVALFGSTRPYLDAGGSRARVLYAGLHCSPCRRHPTCHGEYPCMKAHTVESVLTAACDILEAPA
jgi:heptosyltransferase-1